MLQSVFIYLYYFYYLLFCISYMQQAMFVREKAGKNAKAELYVVL